MDKLREILRLYELGYSECQIAQSCAVGRSTVQYYIRLATAKDLSYEQVRKLDREEIQKQLGKRRQQHTHETELILHSDVKLTLVLQEDMDSGKWQYSQQSKDQFLAWAEQVGPQTNAQVQAIFDLKAHEEQAIRAIKRLQQLAHKYGHARLEAACHRVNVFGIVGLRRVHSLLETGLDQMALPTERQPTLCPHTKSPLDS